MKLFAEEKRQNTIELLFSSPLGNLDIILAKFLATMTLVFFMLLLTVLFPLSLGVNTFNEWLIIGSSCVGVIFCLCVYISVGLFASSLTNNPTVAAVISFCILFFLLLLILSPQAVQNPLIGEMLQYMSPATHYEGFSRGVIKNYSVLYFFSFTGFMFFLTKLSLDSRNW
jgi:ABC-2 type transport system permease protein